MSQHRPRRVDELRAGPSGTRQSDQRGRERGHEREREFERDERHREGKRDERKEQRRREEARQRRNRKERRAEDRAWISDRVREWAQLGESGRPPNFLRDSRTLQWDGDSGRSSQKYLQP